MEYFRNISSILRCYVGNISTFIVHTPLLNKYFFPSSAPSIALQLLYFFSSSAFLLQLFSSSTSFYEFKCFTYLHVRFKKNLFILLHAFPFVLLNVNATFFCFCWIKVCINDYEIWARYVSSLCLDSRGQVNRDRR